MKLTKPQLELAAKYLAMSNICTLDRFRRDGQIKDLASLQRCVHQAWEDAVTGYMESMDGGYDDRNESKAIRDVEKEINSFKRDLRKGGQSADFWIAEMQKEVPYLFDVE